ncbi:MAG: endonuclease V [Candidatus Heimdallarchaeota archaeon]
MNASDDEIPEEFREELLKVRAKQKEFAAQIDLHNRINLGEIRTIGGFDVAFDDESNFACAGVVTIDFRTFELIDEQVEIFEPKIPYIPSFLHYREAPGYHKVWEKLEEKPDLLMFDGNGIIHPFSIGLASQMGLELNHPSIGIAKKLMLGEYKEPFVKGGFSYITRDNENIGAAFQTAKKPAKPIYISPGYHVDLQTTINIIRMFSLRQKFLGKLPLPLKLADTLVNERLEGEI